MATLQRRSIHTQDKETDQSDLSPVNGVEKEKNTTDSDERNPTKIGPPTTPSEWLATFYHFAMSVFYVLLLYHGTKVMREGLHILDPDGIIPKYGGRFKFLTHINQWIQLGFFTLQFLTDILPKSSFKKRLQNVCDVIFTSLALPMALFVALTFWGIYAVDRKLVYPERFDLFVPSFLNHFWHTTIALWVFLEILLCFHRFPTTDIAVSVNVGFSACYLSWVAWVFMQTDFWVYPIMKVLPLPYLVLFFAACTLFSLGVYYIGKAIAHLRWGQTVYIR